MSRPPPQSPPPRRYKGAPPAPRPRGRDAPSLPRRTIEAAALQVFAQHYRRKAQRGGEPNDRRFNHELVGRIRRMKPEELDTLLRYGEDD